MTMAKLETKGIVKYFKHESHELTALGGVDLKVEDGDFGAWLDLLDVESLPF
jgi:ABC-type oligopeptide transport system ATPase subunit